MLVAVPDWYKCTQLWTNWVKQLSSSSCFIWRRTASARSIRLILSRATAFKAKLTSRLYTTVHLQLRDFCFMKHQKESVVVLFWVKIVCYNRKKDGTLFKLGQVSLYQLNRLFYKVFVDFILCEVLNHYGEGLHIRWLGIALGHQTLQKWLEGFKVGIDCECSNDEEVF